MTNHFTRARTPWWGGGRLRFRRLGIAPLLLALLLQGCDLSSAEDHYQQAVEYAEAGKPRAAVIELKNALRKDSELAPARFMLGRLQLEAGAAADALANLQRARDLGFEGDELLPALLRARLAAGDVEEANRVAAEIAGLDESEQTDELAALEGEALALAGRLDEARNRLESLVERAPKLVDAHLTLARIEFQRRDFAAAERHALNAVQIAPDRAAPWVVVGESRLAAGRLAAAREAFRQAAELQGPAVSSARFGIVRTLMAEGKFEAALEELDHIDAGKAGDLQRRFLRGIALLSTDQADAAVEELDAVLAALPDHVASRYARGVALYRTGRQARALEDLERVIARNPEHLQARLLAAAISSEEGRFERAVEILRAGLGHLSGDRSDAGYLAALGDAELRAGDTERGLEHIRRAAALVPELASIRAQLGIAHLAMGDADSAEAELRRAIDLSDSFPASDTLLILTLLAEKRLDEAAAAVRHFVERSSELPLAHNLAGVVSLARGEFSAAAEAFKTALELDPGFGPAAVNLALVQQAQGHGESAIATLVEVLDRDPANLAALERLVDIAGRAGKTDVLDERLRAANAAAPGSEPILVLMARAQRASGDLEGAYRTLAVVEGRSREFLLEKAELAQTTGRAAEAVAALEAVPGEKSSRVITRLVGALRAAGRNQRAIDTARGWLEGHPDDATVRLALAQMLLDAGDYQGAIEQYEVVDNIRPDMLIVLNNLAWARGRLGELDRGIELARRALAIAPSNPAVQDTVGWLLLQRGDVDQAADHLARAVEGSPGDGEVRFHYASLLAAQGRKGAAIEQLRQALAADTLVSKDAARELLSRLGS